MKIFKKSKKESSCCNFQVEDLSKDNKKQKPSCCDLKIEEIKDDNKYNNKFDGCCN